jgi:outer membrane protein
LTGQNLRSTPDLSFANVQMSQAQLLQLNAANAAQKAMAALNAILGSESDEQFDLADETPADPQVPPANAEDLVQLAFRARPDLAAFKRSLNRGKAIWFGRARPQAAHHQLRPPLPATAGSRAGGFSSATKEQVFAESHG